jgi:hypothetical protein
LNATRNETTESLFDFAQSEGRRPREWIEKTVAADNLDERGWPEFMPEEIRDVWPGLSLDARLIAFTLAFRDYLVCDLEQTL